MPENVTNRAKKETNRRKKRPEKERFLDTKTGLIFERDGNFTSIHAQPRRRHRPVSHASIHGLHRCLLGLDRGFDPAKKQKAHHATCFFNKKMLHEWNNCATIQNERTKSKTKNMIRQWNEFKGRAVTLERGRLRVSLNKQCQVILNRVAHERMGSPEAVVLLYDERYRVVGLRTGASGPYQRISAQAAVPDREERQVGTNGHLRKTIFQGPRHPARAHAHL
jgi:hypothetical protein